MKGLWWAGSALLAVGLGWWALDGVLATAFPLGWGSPANIGRGLFLLAAWALALVGAIMAAIGGLALLSTRHRWQRRLLAPLGLNAVIALAVVAAEVLLPGPTSYNGWLPGIVGDTGVTVDEAGRPVLVLAVCTGSVDHLTVVGPNRGDQPNELLLELSSGEPATGLTLVDLTDPWARWGGVHPAPLPVDSQELLIASAESSRNALRQVDFTAADLASLDPQTVLVDGRRVPLADVQSTTCSAEQQQD